MWISLKQVDILTLSYSQRTAVGITNSGGLDNHAFMYRVTHKGWDFREEYTESKLCFLTLMIYCNCKFCCFCLTNRYIILFKPILRAEDICDLEIVTLKEFQIVRKVCFFVNNPVYIAYYRVTQDVTSEPNGCIHNLFINFFLAFMVSLRAKNLRQGIVVKPSFGTWDKTFLSISIFLV